MSSTAITATTTTDGTTMNRAGDTAATLPVRIPTTHWTRRMFDALAHRLDGSGPEAVLPELVDVAVAARDRGINGAAVDLLVDPSAPWVVRERAFAVVMRRMNV